ncbi:MAG: phosphonate-binding protein [Caulobacterales bacterium 32-69-10]|nr:MAG: phosphonate-binding protein [Caulobacterales bacterium 32-69-10]
MSDRPSGAAPSRVVAVLGPTNTGKTHLAVERMLGHASGMIGLPLRLLAREIYDRVVKLRGARAVALITGEEKIVPPHAAYFVCTVEAMPLGREVEFLAVDEIQLCADPNRGHVFTHRLLHARGKHETMFMGAAAMAPLIRRLLPDAELVSRERFSALTFAGSKKLTRLPRRSAVVAFSTDAVYAIAELIRRQRGGAAVVMGSLSPRTRNAQVALYQSGEVDFLVATDAIGMGLNMDVDHVAFAGLRKFDGKRTRWLYAPEIGQIAGRAGRFRTDGTFGITADCPDMDEDLVASVESHSFEPLTDLEWRSAALDFDSLKDLIRSLAAPPVRPGLKLAEEALDEKTLKLLAGDEDVARRARDRVNLRRLWEVAQTPDFRKAALDEHVRLTRTLFDHLSTRDRRLPEDWMAGQYATLDHVGGEIDVLAQRLAGMRTLTYIANRPDWLRDAGHWQAKTRALEDRLSDTLHEKLMQRFIDRRTSVLMKALSVREEVEAVVGADGAVSVEGHFVGRLEGLRFDLAQGETALEDKALRGAAQAAVAPVLAKRLGALAGEPDGAFALQPDGLILWRGAAAGDLAGGDPFSPRARLFGELGPEPVRERARRRLEAFVAAEAGRRLEPLKRLQAATADGSVKGLARGVAYRLIEAGGLVDRRSVAADVAGLSQAERRTLRALGVRFGAFSIFMPALLEPQALAFSAAFARLEAPGWTPPAERLSALPGPVPAPRVLAARGLRACGPYAVPPAALERLDEILRAAPRDGGGAVLSDAALEPLGWPKGAVGPILRALGYAPSRRRGEAEPQAWRRRPDADQPPPGTVRPDSPFAALAALTAPPPPARRKRRRAPKAAARP